jgi:hypothetical protein
MNDPRHPPETMDAFIDRRYAEIKAEFAGIIIDAYEFVSKQFHAVSKRAHYSIAQRQRRWRERVHNNGNINQHKPRSVGSPE